MHSLILNWSEWDILDLQSGLYDILSKNDKMAFKILKAVG